MISLYRIAVPLLGRFYQRNSLFIFIVPVLMAVFSRYLTVTGIPTIFAAIAWGVFSSPRTSGSRFFFYCLSFAAQFLFVSHPAASGAELFAAHWLVIPACGILTSFIKNAYVKRFLVAMIAAYVAHAAGALIYIHTIPTTPLYWQLIIPKIWFERLTLTIIFLLVDYLIDLFFYLFNKDESLSYFRRTRRFFTTAGQLVLRLAPVVMLTSPLLWGSKGRRAMLSSYSGEFSSIMEELNGEGFVNPGGPELIESFFFDVDLKGKIFVEIDCGLSGAAKLLSPKELAHMHFVAMDKKFVTASRENAKKWGLADRMTVHLSYYDKLPFDDNSIDIVYARDTVSQLPLWLKGAMLLEVYRVLKPGGIFIATDWICEKEGSRLKELFFKQDSDFIRMYTTSMDKYLELIDGAGFLLIDLRSLSSQFIKKLEGYQKHLASGAKDIFVKKFGTSVLQGYEKLCARYIQKITSGNLGIFYFKLQKPPAKKDTSLPAL